MFRLALLILVLAALVIFALQNVSPVMPLVFLGMQTQALPLAVWVVGAIAAGAITTVLFALIIRLAGGRNRSRRPRPRRASGRSTGAAAGTPWTPPPWTGDRSSAQPVDAAASYGTKANRTGTTDDWEQPQNASEAWDNWDDARPVVDAPRRARPAARTVIQDASYTDVTDRSAAYQPPFYPEPDEPRDSYREQVRAPFRDEYQPPVESDREEWDDWEEEELGQPASATSRRPDPRVEPEPEPPRNIVEIQREPQAGYQTGSVFSYTYRSSDPQSSEPEPDLEPAPEPDLEPEELADEVADALVDLERLPPDEPTTASSRSVYDAEFRVIIPPYRTELEPPDLPNPSAVEPTGQPIVESARAVEPELNTYLRETDDWEEDDGDNVVPDPPRRGQPPQESSSRGRLTPDPLEREVWDDWDDDDEADDQPPPSASPEGNPPLRLG